MYVIDGDMIEMIMVWNSILNEFIKYK